MKSVWLKNIADYCPPPTWLCCLLLLVVATPALAGDPFGLTGNWSYRESGGDTGSASIFSQGYTLNYNKELSQFIAVNGAVRYNDNQPSVGGSNDSLNPSLSFDLRNDLFFVNLGASRSQNNRENAPSSYTDTLGGTFYTLNRDWPVARLFFSTSDHSDDSRPHLKDSESLTLGGSVEYELAGLGILYDFRNSITDDHVGASKSENIEHLVHLKYTRSFFQDRLTLAASQQYQNNETISEISPGLGGEFLLPVTSLAAFSGADDTPAFGVLPSNPSLIDGDEISPAGVDIATTIVAQNMAVQINFQPVNRLRIFLDQQLTATLQSLLDWELWQSADGSTWTQISGIRPTVYQLENAQTVVVIDLLAPVNSRFLKAVSRIGLVSATPVLVTEMEVGETQTSTASRVTIRSRLINYQTEFNANYRPGEKWQIGYNMRLNQNDQDRGTSSTQLNQSVNVGYFPTERLSYSFGVSENYDRIDGSEERNTRNYAVSVSSALLSTLNLSLGYTRIETANEGSTDTSSDNINVVINAILFPDLTASLSNNWSRAQNHDGSEVTSFGVVLNAYARMSPRFDLNLTASYVESDNSGVAETAETEDAATRYSLNATYRPSDILLLSSSFNRDEESDQNVISGTTTILATRQIQTIFGYSLAFGAEESQQFNNTWSWLLTRQISLQANGNYLTADDGNSWAFISTVNANF